MIPINAIYVGFQGEGMTVGLPTIFVRVAGCNFFEDDPSHPCIWCDSPYSWRKSDAKLEFKSVDSLLAAVTAVSAATGVRSVCVTGGEPLSLPESEEMVERIGRRFETVVETNGSLPIWVAKNSWSLDMKCPSSGNDSRNNYDNLKILGMKDQVKFVIQDEEDFKFAKKVYDNRVVLTNVFFQPAWKTLII